MNRIIKFRVWDKLDEQMVPWEECEDTELLRDAFKGKDAIAMQFTGLKDEQDKEIYEGDFFRYSVNGQVYSVIYLNGTFRNNAGYDLMFYVENGISVIGNIFENPELCAKEEIR